MFRLITNILLIYSITHIKYSEDPTLILATIKKKKEKTKKFG